MALVLIDYVAVAVFAATGALVAVERRVDVIGVLWLAAITGIGGGTVRDLLLGQPVFWVREPTYIIIAAATAVLVYLTAGLPQTTQRILLWLDAAGLAFVAVSGAAKALTVGAAPSIALVMGMITAALGGIIRDVLAHEPSILLRKEIYVTAAMLGAGVYLGAHALGASEPLSAILGITAGFGLRAGAIVFGWTLPGARGKDGDPDGGAGKSTP